MAGPKSGTHAIVLQMEVAKLYGDSNYARLDIDAAITARKPPKQTCKDQGRQKVRNPERTAAVQRIAPTLSTQSDSKWSRLTVAKRPLNIPFGSGLHGNYGTLN